jgi:hypothetical protein
VNKLLSYRISASALHLTLSALIFFIFLGVLIAAWYPAPYFSASGGWQGLQLVMLVDLVLGPLLTFIVFDPRKSRRELVTDLSLIAVLQLTALVWGVLKVYEQRPVAAVFWENSFFTVPASSITRQGESVRELSKLGDTSPVLIYAVRPASITEHEALIKRIAETQIPPHEQVDRYRSLLSNFESVKLFAIDIAEIVAQNPAMRAEFEKITRQTGTELDSNIYLPMISRYRNVILIFNEQGRLLGTVSAPRKTGEV